MSENKVQIIGVGDDGLEGLTAAARKYVDQADLLIGAEKSLNAVARDIACFSVRPVSFATVWEWNASMCCRT